MAQLQFQQWNSWKGGIDDSGQKPGAEYFSIGMDPYRDPSYQAVADTLAKSVDDNDIGTFSEPIYAFQEISGDLFALDSGGDIWKRDAGTGWVNDGTWPHADGNAGQGQDIFEFNSELFWAADTTVGRIQTPTGAPTFTDSWQTGLTSSSWHPMEKFLGKMFVGHGRNIASWDTVSWNATNLILPAGFVSKSMAVIGDFLAIGTVAPAGEDSRIFLWDGTSATYNAEVAVKATAVDAMFTWSNTLWAIAGKSANLHYYDGSALNEVGKIADVDVQSGQSVVVRPRGITVYRNRIVIAVNTLSEIGDRIMPGIWGFDPSFAQFKFDHTLSTGVMNASGHAYSVFSDGTDIWIGGQDDNTGATSQYFVDKSGGSKYTETAYWISPFFKPGSFADKHWRKFFVNLKEFPSSGSDNEITVKYRSEDRTRRLNNGAEFTATAGAASTIDVASTTGLQVGDEITLTGGPSAGDLRRIITLTATKITVDRAFTATPVNAQTKFVAERWVEAGTVTSADGDEFLKSWSIADAVGKSIQFKVEMRDAETTGEEVNVSEMALSFIQKRPV